MIKINSLNKYFNKNKNNEIHVIDNTSMELPDTGFITFLGQSGSGKTTLLNVIGGLDRYKGDISFDDINLQNYPMKEFDNYRSRNIGYVFQNYNLLNDISVYNNIKISLDLIGITDEEEIDKRIKYCLSAVGMYDYKNRIASSLSGGQQQRVSIARALAKNAKLLIADEPTGNLDKKNSADVMNILRSISNTMLVLLVTHSEEFASYYSDRIIRIKDGNVIDDNINAPFKSDLNLISKNEIYLKDLDNSSVSSNEIHYEMFKMQKDNYPEAKFRLIYLDGVFYVDCDKPVKVVGDKNKLILLDKHREVLENSKKYKNEFDLSTFSDTSADNKRSKKELSYFLKRSWNNIRKSRMFSKIMNFGLFSIGIMFAVSVIAFFILYGINYDGLTTQKNAYSVDDFQSSDFYIGSSRDVISNLYSDPEVYDISLGCSYIGGQEAYPQKASYYDAKKTKIISSSRNDLIKNSKLTLYDNEIILDKRLAKKMYKVSGSNKFYPDKLLGQTVNVFDYNFNVVGFCDSGSMCFYVKDYVLDSYYFGGKISEGNNYILGSENEYNLISGKNPEGKYDILVSADYYPNVELNQEYSYNNDFDPLAWNYLIKDETQKINNFKLKIVGTYRLKNGQKTNKIIGNNKALVRVFNFKANYYLNLYTEFKNFMFTNSSNSNIISGNKPSKQNEIAVSKNSGFNIGETITMRKQNDMLFKVVGITDEFNSQVITLSDSTFDKYYLGYINNMNLDEVKQFAFKTNNIKLESKKYDVKFIQNEDYVRQNSQYGAVPSTIIIIVIIIIILSIYIYFIMRSRMISNIYDIGVYRSIGVKKSKIYKMFAIELTEIMLITSFLGYLVVLILFGIKGEYVISNMGYNTPSTEVLKYSLLGLLLIIVLNYIMGLLPLHRLLKKTPSEILTKYDI